MEVVLSYQRKVRQVLLKLLLHRLLKVIINGQNGSFQQGHDLKFIVGKGFKPLIVGKGLKPLVNYSGLLFVPFLDNK